LPDGGSSVHFSSFPLKLFTQAPLIKQSSALIRVGSEFVDWKSTLVPVIPVLSSPGYRFPMVWPTLSVTWMPAFAGMTNFHCAASTRWARSKGRGISIFPERDI